MEGEYRLVGRCRSRELLGNLASPYPACRFFFPDLDFFGFFICEAYLLVEIFLDELESFPAGLEEDVVKFRERLSHAQRLEQIPQSDWYHINHWG